MDFAKNEISGNPEKTWKKHASEKIEQNLCVDPTSGHPGAVLGWFGPFWARKNAEKMPQKSSSENKKSVKIGQRWKKI